MGNATACICLGGFVCLVWSRRCSFWPVSYDGCCWLPSYLAFCLLQLQSSHCKHIRSNRAPRQLTNIRLGGEKPNKAICECLGFSVNCRVVIILAQRHQCTGNAGEHSPTPSQACPLPIASPAEKALTTCLWSDNRLFFSRHTSISEVFNSFCASSPLSLSIKMSVKATKLQQPYKRVTFQPAHAPHIFLPTLFVLSVPPPDRHPVLVLLLCAQDVCGCK